jgi:hypothetical protein
LTKISTLYAYLYGAMGARYPFFVKQLVEIWRKIMAEISTSQEGVLLLKIQIISSIEQLQPGYLQSKLQDVNGLDN